MWIETTATVKVRTKSVIAELSRDLADFYLALLPKCWNVTGQRHSTHVTIVRSSIEPFNPWARLYDGRTIKIKYKTGVRYKYPYFFLVCQSDDIKRIRTSLGMPPYRPGFSCYHTTIGNVKEIP